LYDTAPLYNVLIIVVRLFVLRHSIGPGWQRFHRLRRPGVIAVGILILREVHLAVALENLQVHRVIMWAKRGDFLIAIKELAPSLGGVQGTCHHLISWGSAVHMETVDSDLAADNTHGHSVLHELHLLLVRNGVEFNHLEFPRALQLNGITKWKQAGSQLLRPQNTDLIGMNSKKINHL
jgi:hypothetical protein